MKAEFGFEFDLADDKIPVSVMETMIKVINTIVSNKLTYDLKIGVDTPIEIKK